MLITGAVHLSGIDVNSKANVFSFPMVKIHLPEILNPTGYRQWIFIVPDPEELYPFHLTKDESCFCSTFVKN